MRIAGDDTGLERLVRRLRLGPTGSTARENTGIDGRPASEGWKLSGSIAEWFTGVMVGFAGFAVSLWIRSWSRRT
jgi:hypothetical protein